MKEGFLIAHFTSACCKSGNVTGQLATDKKGHRPLLHLIVQIANSVFITLFTRLVSLSSLIDKKYILIMIIIKMIIITITITTQLFDVNCNDLCN